MYTRLDAISDPGHATFATVGVTARGTSLDETHMEGDACGTQVNGSSAERDVAGTAMNSTA